MCMDTTIRVVVTFLVMVLAGCTSHSHVVRCDGRLEPINAPMPREGDVAEPVDSRQPEAKEVRP
jgi:hypothetical protein